MTGRALTAYSLSLLLAELATLDQAAHRLDADQADATPTELVLAASSLADQAEKLAQRANQLLRHACRAEERVSDSPANLAADLRAGASYG